MTEDAHEEMLLSEATSTDTSNSATTANNEDCVTEDNMNYAGAHVRHVASGMPRLYLEWCQLWCHDEKRAKYFRYNKVEKMCWCLDVVESRNEDQNYTSGICGSSTGRSKWQR